MKDKSRGDNAVTASFSRTNIGCFHDNYKLFSVFCKYVFIYIVTYPC